MVTCNLSSSTGTLFFVLSLFWFVDRCCECCWRGRCGAVWNHVSTYRRIWWLVRHPICCKYNPLSNVCTRNNICIAYVNYYFRGSRCEYPLSLIWYRHVMWSVYHVMWSVYHVMWLVYHVTWSLYHVTWSVYHVMWSVYREYSFSLLTFQGPWLFHDHTVWWTELVWGSSPTLLLLNHVGRRIFPTSTITAPAAAVIVVAAAANTTPLYYSVIRTLQLSDETLIYWDLPIYFVSECHK